ncbi:diphosphomevalonate decarboxylase [Candidatus Dependentiae bacterium]|nr:diphosphomevalonate decarboxylase [Candidatus Dependentiae bacterium]
MKKITIQTYANIALIKYWGKRDKKLFLPTKSSLSISLPYLKTSTTISESNTDKIVGINTGIQNVKKFLNLFRKIYQIKKNFKIETTNNFPTAAGLASSASGFAAIAKGLNKFCNLNLSNKELSILARYGSGSATRSIQQGFVLWNKGDYNDGSDSYAFQIFDQNFWPEFCIIIVIINSDQKNISSRQAMQITVNTCSFYKNWIHKSEKRIPKMLQAIKTKDFTTVGKLAELDCLQMHKCMKNSFPAINYWQKQTLQIIDFVKNLRKQKIHCYFTIDAGPNVKIICLKKDRAKIINNLLNICNSSQIMFN